MNASATGGDKVRVINVSKNGAGVQCRGVIFTLKRNGVGVLYFGNNRQPIWRVYSNTRKAADFILTQPLARTYLFIHRLEGANLIFARHYPKGAFGEWKKSNWASHDVVRLSDLSKTWSSYEKKCGKGNVRLAFISPMKFGYLFYLDESRYSSVMVETWHETPCY